MKNLGKINSTNLLLIGGCLLLIGGCLVFGCHNNDGSEKNKRHFNTGSLELSKYIHIEDSNDGGGNGDGNNFEVKLNDHINKVVEGVNDEDKRKIIEEVKKELTQRVKDNNENKVVLTGDELDQIIKKVKEGYFGNKKNSAEDENSDDSTNDSSDNERDENKDEGNNKGKDNKKNSAEDENSDDPTNDPSDNGRDENKDEGNNKDKGKDKEKNKDKGEGNNNDKGKDKEKENSAHIGLYYGLNNIGNSCYQASAIQGIITILSNIDNSKTLLNNWKVDEGTPKGYLKTMLLSYLDGKLEDFKKAQIEFRKYFISQLSEAEQKQGLGQQHDATEFLDAMMKLLPDAIMKHTLQKIRSVYCQYKYLSGCASEKGHTETTKINNEKPDKAQEGYYCPISIFDTDLYTNDDGVLEIDKIIKEYTDQKDTTTNVCPICANKHYLGEDKKKPNDCVKYNLLKYKDVEIEELFVAYVTRINVIDGELNKNNKDVNMPLEFSFDKGNYKLIYFGQHDGGMNGGHWYGLAKCKTADYDGWIKCDDSDLSKVTQETVDKERKTSIFYIYKKV